MFVVYVQLLLYILGGGDLCICLVALTNAMRQFWKPKNNSEKLCLDSEIPKICRDQNGSFVDMIFVWYFNSTR